MLNEDIEKKISSEISSTRKQLKKLPNNTQSNDVNCIALLLSMISYLILLVTFPFSLLFMFRIVKEYERAVIFRAGRLRDPSKGPGLVFVLPCMESVYLIDLRVVSYDVPTQEILTKDSVTIRIDAVVYYRIFDVSSSILNVADANYSTELISATCLRNLLGTRDLQEILSSRLDIGQSMKTIMDEITHDWGVKVERVELQDITLPSQMQRVMASEAEATREARAKMIAAEGEKEASISLCEAANVMDEAPMSIEFRTLQSLQSICTEKASTLLFPIPLSSIISKSENMNLKLDDSSLHSSPSTVSHDGQRQLSLDLNDGGERQPIFRQRNRIQKFGNGRNRKKVIKPANRFEFEEKMNLLNNYSFRK
ncbi:hypothetical protein SNEBB_006799 [Seison nebaliae]|nr:hypothetical protein SNEBB_006799 [Seison nebaliae]